MYERVHDESMNAVPASFQPSATAPRLPARHDHVGSFLRPPFLLEARARFARHEIDARQLREVEDRAIAEIVRFQQDVGLKAITDGEYRREYFHIDFLDQLGGVQTTLPETIRRADGSEELRPPVIRVNDKVRHARNIEVANYRHLQSCLCAGCTAKVAIPSPTMLHFRGGRGGISQDAYPELEPVFYDDVARAYGDELQALSAAGCSYVQLDDTNLAYLCDPGMRQGAIDRGDDPNELPRTYAALINEALVGRPDDLTVAVHLCRGNFRSMHFASGSYDPVAEVLFNELEVDAYFLEYDDERSGDFAPLRFFPDDKTLVLGIVTSKRADLEDKDLLRARIHEAAEYVDLDRMCLSPQCGFSSTIHGNQITEDDQWAKLRHVVEVAESVWN